MTRKIYRTASGKQVDLGALQLQNENIRAVGNMNVNARGDTIDGWNQPITNKNASVQKNYQRQTSNVTNQPVTKAPDAEASKKPKPVRANKAPKPVVEVPPAPEDFDDDFQRPVESTAAAKPAGGGLAAAIARARTIREQPVTTHQELAKNKPDIKKI